jgi:hypothetical protein
MNIVFSTDIEVDAYEERKSLLALISKESDTLKRVLLKKRLAHVEVSIASYEWHMAEQRKKEIAEKQRQKKINRENNVIALIICLILFMPVIIMGIVLNIRANEVLKEAEKPYVFKKTNHTQKLHNVK